MLSLFTQRFFHCRCFNSCRRSSFVSSDSSKLLHFLLTDIFLSVTDTFSNVGHTWFVCISIRFRWLSSINQRSEIECHWTKVGNDWRKHIWFTHMSFKILRESLSAHQKHQLYSRTVARTVWIIDYLLQEWRNRAEWQK